MARGPFQGTWNAGVRPTVVTAPDAIVYINGESEVIGCPSCSRRFDFNKYITSVQVDLNVNSVPGSASVSMSIPRHALDKFFVDGNALVTPMMEIEIYAKGYFLVEGVPQYYPIFWGIITEVNDSYSGGEHTVSISCADILKWWELCRMNINPAFTGPVGQLGKSIFGNVFFGMNPYDVIWTLCQQAYGDVVVGSGSLVSMQQEAFQKSTFSHAMLGMMAYWEQRFTKIRSNLLLYGTSGNAVRGDILYAQYNKTKGGVKGGVNPIASQAVRQGSGGDNASQIGYDPTDPQVVAFRTQFMQAGQVNFWTSEFQTKLELANAAKEAIGFEFYMDVTGDIVFKPPFYNLDILSNKPVSWIQDIDIIDWSLGDSESEVVTQIQLQGSYAGNIDYGLSDDVTPYTSVTDYHLLRKYGWRPQTFNSEFLGSPMLMFYAGMDLLDRYNSKRFSGTVSIPMRPELRLGFPVYIASKDQIWYVSGISHNLTFGGRAQTTLSLTAKRTKFIAPVGIGSIELVGFSGGKGAPAKPVSDLQDGASTLSAKQLAEGGRFKVVIGDAAEIPPFNTVIDGKPGDLDPYKPLLLRHPKTGRLVGYPNVVMAYTRPVEGKEAINNLPTGKKKPGTPRSQAKIKKTQAENERNVTELDGKYFTVQTNDKLRDKYLNNRYQYGLNSAGVYTYLHDKSSVLREFVLLPLSHITGITGSSASGMMRPVSDERGFEVIGHYRYGRGVSLRDGSLVINQTEKGGPNERAQVDTQLALSGNLSETLNAQSSGLTTITTGYVSPAAAITSLVPEDLMTAGIVNPNTSQPEFRTTGTNFIDVAPLGSEEKVGSVNTGDRPSVEASQLSRALTIAELSVKDGPVPDDKKCDCNLATSDLAFIAQGYQLKNIGESSDDTSTIQFGSVETDSTALSAAASRDLALLNGQRQAASDAAALEARRVLFTDPEFGQLGGLGESVGTISEEQDRKNAELTEVAENQARSLAEKQFMIDHASEYDDIGVDATSVALKLNTPVADNSLRGALSIGKVEAFLTNLYSVLDDSHQQWEKGLRGDLIESPRVSAQDVRFGTPENRGGISAPFDRGRQLGGNPDDLARMGDEAREAIADEWDAFAEELASNAEKALLQAEIQRLTHEASQQTGAEQTNTLIALQKAQQDYNVLAAKYQ